jgi:hypothetical protein
MDRFEIYRRTGNADLIVQFCQLQLTTSKPALPREMQEHTYPIMFEVEGRHWWFLGRRQIIAVSSHESVKTSGNQSREFWTSAAAREQTCKCLRISASLKAWMSRTKPGVLSRGVCRS